MSLQYTTALRNAWLTTLNTTLGAGAKLLIYSGSVPANCAAGPTGTLLSSGVVGNVSGWGSVAGGVLTMNNVTADTNAAATGIAGYFRWLDASNNVVDQGTVSLPSGGGDLIMINTAIVSGDTVTVTSWTITAPGA